jgi:hypothetical protein
MWHALKTLLCKLDGYRYKRSMARALALHVRGEGRRDGLNPTSSTTHLAIEWRARDIHPWDRSLLTPAQKAAAFMEQSLYDTEDAVHRLLEALPQVNVIAVKVLDQVSGSVIISGAVSREDGMARNEALSIGMRIRYLGLTYHSAGSRFEVLEEVERG